MNLEDIPLISSMTGYGRGTASTHGRKITIEVRAVNNRYLDCSIKLPRALIFAEDALKKRVSQSVSRGKVDVFVTVESQEAGAMEVMVNEPLAKSYLSALRQLFVLGGGMVKDCFYATDLARMPDVLTVTKAEENLEQLSADLTAVLDLALEDFDRMRREEGEKLAQDVLHRADAIEKLLEQVEARSPQTVTEYRAKLEARIREVLENKQLDESRILTEAALFADKVAVDEETVRLHSHLDQLRQMLKQGGAVGRKLDFLIQEFNREANTIGSKCSDLEISRVVVDLKAEIEKIREQVQNIE